MTSTCPLSTAAAVVDHSDRPGQLAPLPGPTDKHFRLCACPREPGAAQQHPRLPVDDRVHVRKALGPELFGTCGLDLYTYLTQARLWRGSDCVQPEVQRTYA